jgi:hypothetical protein
MISVVSVNTFSSVTYRLSSCLGQSQVVVAPLLALAYHIPVSQGVAIHINMQIYPADAFPIIYMHALILILLLILTIDIDGCKAWLPRYLREI